MCGVEDPCPVRLAALRWLDLYGVLPTRIPGTTQPERIGLRRAWGDNSGGQAPNWFTASTDVDQSMANPTSGTTR